MRTEVHFLHSIGVISTVIVTVSAGGGRGCDDGGCCGQKVPRLKKNDLSGVSADHA